MENQVEQKAPNHRINPAAVRTVEGLLSLLVVLGVVPQKGFFISDEEYKKLFEQGLASYFERLPDDTGK